ncbi:PD-(D/E)XK nuclease family protein [Methanococcus maripaludis]|uniref:PD-(D/E)XK endonuclease-like domain-containing protein n=1 Tax=Methanococcus maripaludis OS7 TaxID=637915 RepID=A0A2Z5PFZ1_METMI|nr:PD-(D/E)XK nuclease family protein [Methanococcus maripaludis]BAP62902.1 hypothetical protein MMOS7_08160 [Methanococcus maripaludis OS7]
MGFQSVKSVEELYGEVKTKKIVLTNDAALATALNKRIDKPMIGKFAYTSQELAQKFIPMYFDEQKLSKTDVILKISKDLGYDIKSVHSAVEKIVEIKKHTRDVSKYINSYEKRILEKYNLLATTENAIEKFDFYNHFKEYSGSDVAVIGYELFNEIDKLALPSDFTKISPFKEEMKDLKNFYLFKNENEISDRISDIITDETQNDFAIILNTESTILDILKSKFYKKGIKLNIKEYLHQNLNLRSVLNILTLSFQINELYLRDLAPYFEMYNIGNSEGYSNYTLKEYSENITADDKFTKLYEFLKNISEYRFLDLLTFLNDFEIEIPYEFKKTLQKLEIYDKKITYQNIQNLIYYIDSFDVEIGNSKAGVLLVDAKNSVYVDKPVCIYVNIDSSWTKDVKKAPYILRKAEEYKNLSNFQIMLSQGQLQYCFVTEFKNGEKTIPCFYFNQIFGKEIESFGDEIFHVKNLSNNKNSIMEEVSEIFEVKEPITKHIFSQSSLNNFVLCPKIYEISRLYRSDSKNYHIKGNLLHEFAEFYVNYPEFVKEKGLEYFAEILSNEYSKLIDILLKDIEKTEFLIAIRNTVEFIDSTTFDFESTFNLKSKKQNENFLSKLFEMPLFRKNTEVYFEDLNYGLNGFIDLLINNSTILDYKSSKSVKSASKILKLCNIKKLGSEIDFQPMVYLLKLRTENPNKSLSFKYYFFLGNKNKVLDGTGRFDENIVDIAYYPTSFNDFILSDEGFELVLGSKDRLNFVNTVSKEYILEYFTQNPFNSEMANEFLEEHKSGFMDHILAYSPKKTVEKGALSFYNEVLNIKNGTSRAVPKALFFKEDLDNFEEFLKGKNEEVKLYSSLGYPYLPSVPELCKNCEYSDICLKRGD